MADGGARTVDTSSRASIDAQYYREPNPDYFGDYFNLDYLGNPDYFTYDTADFAASGAGAAAVTANTATGAVSSSTESSSTAADGDGSSSGSGNTQSTALDGEQRTSACLLYTSPSPRD